MNKWQQIKIGSIGQTVVGIEDIEQCIKTILLTPKGQVPHRPNFGADLLKYLDNPTNTTIPLIIAEVMRAINDNEPRARVVNIKAVVKDGYHVLLTITWTLADNKDIIYITEVMI